MSLLSADELMQELEGRAVEQPKTSHVVHFCIEAQENIEKSKKAGRPVFEDVEIVEIRNPGDIDIIRKPVEERDRQAFPRQYLAFKKSQSQEAVNGFPLAQWGQIKRHQAEEARVLGIHTIEQLASVSDGNLQRLGPGWTQLRQMARDWEKAAKDGAATVALRNQLDGALAKIATLEEMLKKQAAELHQQPSQASSTVPGSGFEYVSPADQKMAALEAKLERLLAGNQAGAAPVEAAPLNGAKKIDGRSKEAKAAKKAAQAKA